VIRLACTKYDKTKRFAFELAKRKFEANRIERSQQFGSLLYFFQTPHFEGENQFASNSIRPTQKTQSTLQHNAAELRKLSVNQVLRHWAQKA
jgi:hypothetical protein